MDNLLRYSSAFGADPSSLHSFEHEAPELLSYTTLLNAQRSGHRDQPLLRIVGAVYEWQGAPLAFLVDADLIENEDQINRIRRLLAMRGDAPYLALVGAGQLRVYRIALDSKQAADARVDLENDDFAPSTAFPRLANLRPQAETSQQNWISSVILKLLTGSIDDLLQIKGVSPEDAISLVGRALFTRFLADRELLPAEMCHENDGANLFDNAKTAEATSTWLDTTFNGDLLPLADDIFHSLPADAYHVLSAIMHRAEGGQLFLGWKQKWNRLDFAHIPVGVLSQTYELYLRKHAPDRQRNEGSFYTPHPIADLLVRASFHALDRESISHKARVLDPAVGAGIFLITAFRELVDARWRFDDKRPDTSTLRAILYDQLVGFDINESALRFAGLGLYLTLIELDPNPRPVDKLRFKNLRGQVLHRVSNENEGGAQLGSLGPLVGPEHNGKYDLVVGNPPWSKGTALSPSEWSSILESARTIGAERGIDEPTLLPGKALDLAFVWRAMEWAKPNGQIGFALHARLLFQQNQGMPKARLALFQAINITSIINGSELRQTKVWPQISAPFCLMFATNGRSDHSGGFRFINPRYEESLNQTGTMRIDASNAELLSVHQLHQTPEMLKILFRGTKADLGVIQRIQVQEHPTLGEFWIDAMGSSAGGKQLKGSGVGYKTLKPSSSPNRKEDFLPGYDARSLHGLGEVTAETFTEIAIASNELPVFNQVRVDRIRSRDIYRGPILLLHKSPPADKGRIAVSISDHDIVFNETFYGYSVSGFENPTGLSQYLALVLGSQLAAWFILMTSGEFGFEREVIEKKMLERIPLPDFRELTKTQVKKIHTLYNGLKNSTTTWSEVDQWIAKLYGLSEHDLQVISDTLEFNLPFRDNKHQAQIAPTQAEQERFCKELSDELNPWCERLGSNLQVQLLDESLFFPWIGLRISTNHGSDSASISDQDLEGLLRATEDYAATEILLQSGSNELVIGRLAQRRYWSETQASLLAQRIAWSHIDLLTGGKKHEPNTV